MEIHISESQDAADNLALEETLFSLIEPSKEILLLYENSLTVVIGRFQNPWKECRVGLAQKANVPLLRRISGGGTVVHGSGNLNWSFINGNPTLNKQKNLEQVMQTLLSVGVRVIRNERHDLLINTSEKQLPQKVSGSAFRQTAHSSLHHGTLLVDADLDMLKKLLSPYKRDIETKSVGSVGAEVANLTDISASLTTEDVVQAFIQEWTNGEKPQYLHPKTFKNHPIYHKSRERLQSEKWIWESTASFVERFTGLPFCGDAVLQCNIESGRIQKLSFLNEGEKKPPSYDLSPLIGVPYNRSAILSVTSIHDVFPWINDFAQRVES